MTGVQTCALPIYTLQYKLNKLSGLTGINPRTYQGGALYCLALAFLEEERLGNWL